jgi:transposase
MATPTFGIDITKLKFDACLLRADGKLRHKVFHNTANGFARLAEWLTRQGALTAYSRRASRSTRSGRKLLDDEHSI